MRTSSSFLICYVVYCLQIGLIAGSSAGSGFAVALPSRAQEDGILFVIVYIFKPFVRKKNSKSALDLIGEKLTAHWFFHIHMKNNDLFVVW